jgi:hypothetical protein
MFARWFETVLFYIRCKIDRGEFERDICFIYIFIDMHTTVQLIGPAGFFVSIRDMAINNE